MSISLSSFAGVGWQLFTDNGSPLSGGLIYTYQAGTSTPATTYTTNAGNVAHTNPIVLNAAGRVSTGEVWLDAAVTYKFIVKNANDVLIATYDNVPGIASAADLASKFAELANSSNPTLGDAMIGFRQSNTSGNLTDSVGSTVHVKLQESISVKDFGAIGDGSTNDSDAFIAASAYITAAGGGSIIIPPGTYIVGKQTFAGASGLGYAYQGTDIFYCKDCTKPINIYMQGATVKFASGLKFGAFNPVTGNSTGGTVSPNYVDDQRAWLGLMFFFEGCTGGVKISGGVLDGNLPNLLIGGVWGNTGRQLFATGVYVGNGFVGAATYSGNVEISNVNVKDFALDGLYVASDENPMLLQNIIVDGCGRNNITWAGGKNLTMSNVRSVNAGQGVIYSSPGSCFDAEAEVTGYNYNLMANNCQFVNGKESAFISATGTQGEFTFNSCVFGGVIVPTKPFIRMNDCVVIGRIQSPYASTFNVWPPSLYAQNTIFANKGAAYGVNYDALSTLGLIEFLGGNEFAVFENCRFDAQDSFFGTFTGSNTQFRNCYITQTGTATVNGSLIQGTFFGKNVMYLANGQWDFNGDVKTSCIVYGDTSISYASTGTITGWGSIPAAPTINVETYLPKRTNNQYTYNPVTAEWTLASPSTVTGTRITLADGLNSSYISTAPFSGNSYFVIGVNGANRIVVDTSGNGFAGADNTQTWGSAAFRWSVIYAGTGTINTSDANEKQQIRLLSDVEKQVAIKCKTIFRFFKFNDAVIAKGDDARWHFGVIAQDVKAAFESEGLDAHNYGIFCEDTWREFDGNAVPVDDQNMYIENFYAVNGEKVELLDNNKYPDNAVLISVKHSTIERTRLGVRYDQLLAFILSSS